MASKIIGKITAGQVVSGSLFWDLSADGELLAVLGQIILPIKHSTLSSAIHRAIVETIRITWDMS